MSKWHAKYRDATPKLIEWSWWNLWPIAVILASAFLIARVAAQ